MIEPGQSVIQSPYVQASVETPLHSFPHEIRAQGWKAQYLMRAMNQQINNVEHPQSKGQYHENAALTRFVVDHS